LKKFDISGIVSNCIKFFSPNLHCLHQRIQATYCANFIAIFGCVQKL